MRLEWLEDILAVAEAGSFGEAAERRGLTQSAFSRRIRLIEEQIGVELFDRRRKPVALHPATAAHRERIAQMAMDLRALRQALREGGDAVERRVIVASQHTLTAVLGPGMVEAILDVDPRIRAEFVSGNLDACLADLLARRADFVIAYRLPGESHPVRPDFVDVVPIGYDRLVPVFAPTSVATGAEVVASGAFPYVAYPPDIFFGSLVERKVLRMLREGASPVARAETALTHAALEMARAGVGVAWVPRELAKSALVDGALVDLSGSLPGADLEITAIRLRGGARAAAELAWAAVTGDQRRGASTAPT